MLLLQESVLPVSQSQHSSASPHLHWRLNGFGAISLYLWKIAIYCNYCSWISIMLIYNEQRPVIPQPLCGTCHHMALEWNGHSGGYWQQLNGVLSFCRISTCQISICRIPITGRERVRDMVKVTVRLRDRVIIEIWRIKWWWWWTGGAEDSEVDRGHGSVVCTLTLQSRRNLANWDSAKWNSASWKGTELCTEMLQAKQWW